MFRKCSKKDSATRISQNLNDRFYSGSLSKEPECCTFLICAPQIRKLQASFNERWVRLPLASEQYLWHQKYLPLSTGEKFLSLLGGNSVSFLEHSNQLKIQQKIFVMFIKITNVNNQSVMACEVGGVSSAAFSSILFLQSYTTTQFEGLLK